MLPFRVLGFDAETLARKVVAEAGREREGRLMLGEIRTGRAYQIVALVLVGADVTVLETDRPHPERLATLPEFVEAARFVRENSALPLQGSASSPGR